MSIVLGLTGPNAAGKGEIAAYLVRLGFTPHSLSDIVREEASARGLPPDRGTLIRIGNEIRRGEGPGALALRILPRLGAKDVVDSIRNPAEVEALRRRPDFLLVGVTAPLDVRFERTRSRSRPGDPESLEEYRRRESQENSDDPLAQQLRHTFAMSDRVIENDGSLDTLHREIDRLIASVGAASKPENPPV